MQTQRLDHPSPLRLAAFRLGKLKAEFVDAVRAHVDECDDCRRFVEETSVAEHVEIVRAAQSKALADRTTQAEGNSGTIPGLATSSSGSVPPNPPKATHAPEGAPRDLREQTKYRIIRLLGGGGMGSVYEAEHVLMRRPVAIKVISPQLTDRPQAVDRFVREIRAVATIDHHEYIVRAYDAETIGSLLAFVMELVPGQDLDKLASSRGPLPHREACGYMLQALEGLQHAHDHQLVHRDIKPQNLILDSRTNKVRILDFGLAKALSETRQTRDLTATRATMGTFAYMAPEQALDAAQADIRADIYSVGCTLYHLIAGVLPFNHDTDGKLFLAHQSEKAMPLDAVRPGTPAALADVVAWMMAKRPEERPQTPRDAAAALAPFVTGSRPPQTPPQTRLPRRQTILEAPSPKAAGRKLRISHWTVIAGAAVLGVALGGAIALWKSGDSSADAIAAAAESQVNHTATPSPDPTPTTPTVTTPEPVDERGRLSDEAEGTGAADAADDAAVEEAPQPAPREIERPAPLRPVPPRPAPPKPSLDGLVRQAAFPALPGQGQSEGAPIAVELGTVDDVTAPLLKVALKHPKALPLPSAELSIAADETADVRTWTVRLKASAPDSGARFEEAVAQLVLDEGRLRLTRLVSAHAHLAEALAFCTLAFQANELTHDIRFHRRPAAQSIAVLLNRPTIAFDVGEQFAPLSDSIRLKVQNLRLKDVAYELLPRTGVIEVGKQLTINMRTRDGYEAMLIVKLVRAGGKYSVVFMPRFKLGRAMKPFVLEELEAMCDDIKFRLDDEEAIIVEVNRALPDIEYEIRQASNALDRARPGDDKTTIQKEFRYWQSQLKKANAAGKRASGNIAEFEQQIPQLESLIVLARTLREGGAIELCAFAPTPGGGEASYILSERQD